MAIRPACQAASWGKSGRTSAARSRDAVAAPGAALRHTAAVPVAGESGKLSHFDAYSPITGRLASLFFSTLKQQPTSPPLMQPNAIIFYGISSVT